MYVYVYIHMYVMRSGCKSWGVGYEKSAMDSIHVYIYRSPLSLFHSQTHTHTYIHTYIYTCMYVYVCMYTYVCNSQRMQELGRKSWEVTERLDICTYIPLTSLSHTHTHTRTHTHTHIYIHIRVHICMYIYLYIYIYIYVYICNAQRPQELGRRLWEVSDRLVQPFASSPWTI